MATKKKKLLVGIELELSQLHTSYLHAQRTIQFQKAARTYGHLAEFFGKTIGDETLKTKPVFLKDIEIFKGQLEQIIKEKYASKKFICEKTEANIETPKRIPDISETTEDAGHIPTEDESTFVAKYEDQVASLLTTHCNQERAAKSLWDNFTIHNKPGQLLLAATGSGKTYILACFIKNFEKQGYIEKLGSISPWPIIYVTKASIVEQTKKVLRDEYGIAVGKTVHVINIELLRSKLGKLFVKETIKIVNGQEHIEFEWNKWMHPVLFVWDESQILCRAESSIQGEIAQAATKISDKLGANVIHIFASATPFSRPIEGKVFACSTKKEFNYGLQKVKITDASWKTFVNWIADPADPIDYNTEAMKRFTDFFEDCIVRIKGIRPKHRSYNKVLPIEFRTKEEHEEYEKAWEHYQEKKRKIEGSEGLSDAQTRFALLAQFTIFRKAAEKIRRYHLAEFAVQSWNSGHAPAIACAFKGTIVATYSILVNDYNWNREDVSIIWGGSTEALSAKAKLAKRIKESGAEEALKSSGISLEDLGIDLDVDFKEKTEEQYNFEKFHGLLTQTPETRENERMRFQRQDSKLLLFTFKAGGVGLSAHHEAKHLKARSREGLLTPVFSEKELIQALGRLPRITSISDTSQTMVYYKGTIEEHVAERVSLKLNNIYKGVIRSREDWTDIIVGAQYKVTDDEEDEDGLQGDQESLALISNK